MNKATFLRQFHTEETERRRIQAIGNAWNSLELRRRQSKTITEVWKKKLGDSMKRICKKCNQEFQADRKSRQFCSIVCKRVFYRGENSPMYGKIGEKSPGWRGGITSQNESIRRGLQYRLWRKAVFNKDNFVCQECGERGGKLRAHHLKPFSIFPESRFDVKNGLTLCENCHRKTDNFGGKIFCRQYEYTR